MKVSSTLQTAAHWLLRCRQGGRVWRSWAFSIKGRRHFDLHPWGQEFDLFYVKLCRLLGLYVQSLCFRSKVIIYSAAIVCFVTLTHVNGLFKPLPQCRSLFLNFRWADYKVFPNITGRGENAHTSDSFHLKYTWANLQRSHGSFTHTIKINACLYYVYIRCVNHR